MKRTIITLLLLAPVVTHAQETIPSVCKSKSEQNCFDLASMERSALAGNAEDAAALGMIYVMGKMVPKDYKKATKWFQLGADKGNEDAQVLLASLYYDGRGVPQSYEEAYFWVLLASVSGKEDAVELRNNVSRRLSSERVTAVQARAREWRPKQ